MILNSISPFFLQGQYLCAVFAILPLFFQDAGGFAGEIGAIDILKIKNIAKFVSGKTTNTYLLIPDLISFSSHLLR
jgi:hypothetical protein